MKGRPVVFTTKVAIESGTTPNINYLLPQKTGPKSAKEVERLLQAIAVFGGDYPGKHLDKEWIGILDANRAQYYRAKRKWRERHKVR